MKAPSVSDYRELARRRLPRFLFEYIDVGSYEEVTVGKNLADLREVELRQRVLRDVSKLDLSTRLFGREWSTSAVLLGRPWAYALAGAGQAGVAHILQLIRSEMRVAMALTSCSRLSDISRGVLVWRQ